MLEILYKAYTNFKFKMLPLSLKMDRYQKKNLNPAEKEIFRCKFQEVYNLKC